MMGGFDAVEAFNLLLKRLDLMNKELGRIADVLEELKEESGEGCAEPKDRLRA
jgi:hypothetical protein